jgi:hypothetical protein
MKRTDGNVFIIVVVVIIVIIFCDEGCQWRKRKNAYSFAPMSLLS